MSEVQTAVDQGAVSAAAAHPYRIEAPSNGLVYKTNHSERRSFSKDFLAFLPEEERQHWNCHCCREFYVEYGGDVVVTRENGEKVVRSAYFRPEQCPSPELAAAFAAVERKALEGKVGEIRTTWLAPISGETEDGGFRIGRVTYGGWNHIHAVFPKGHRLPDYSVATIEQRVGGARGILSDYGAVGSFEVIEARIKQAVALLDYDGRATDALKRCAATAQAILELVKAVKVRREPVEYAYLTLPVADQNRLFHLAGSTNGKFLQAIVITESDPQTALSNFIAQTDPELYKRAQREADDRAIAEFGKLVNERPGCLEYRLRSPSETPGFVALPKVAVESTKVEEEVKPLSATELLRQRTSRHNEAKSPNKPVERMSVNHHAPAGITIDSFIRTVLPNAERVEVSTTGAARFTFSFQVDPDGLSDATPLAWDSKDSVSSLVNPARWSFVGIKDSWVPVEGICLSPWMDDETTKLDKIHWWVFEGQTEHAEADFLRKVKPPLFADYYKGEFYPHRRSMETLLGSAVVPPTETPAILLPLTAEVIVRVYTNSNILVYYKIQSNDHEAVKTAVDAYKATVAQA